MSPAHRFMHADAGGYLLPSCIASLSTVSKITSKTISKAINACSDLSKGEKRMLSEVCSFVHVGKRGVCDAKNAHFVNECLIAKDSVSRILARLENKGLVTVDPGKDRGNKRLIWPTKRALALYMTPEQIAEVPGSENVDSLSTNVDTPIDQIMQTLSTFVDTPIDFLQGGLSTFSGEAIDFLRVSLLIVKEKYLKEVEERGKTSIAPSSSSLVEPAQSEEIITPQPASQKAEPQTEGGGRRPGAFDEPAECTSADESPLSKPDIFRAICLDEGYPQIDFEHYRLSILNASRDEGLVLPARKWRARIRRWLENAKQAQKLILAAVPGQTKGDPRAVQPLATRSSASPTRKQSWS